MGSSEFESFPFTIVGAFEMLSHNLDKLPYGEPKCFVAEIQLEQTWDSVYQLFVVV